MVWLLSRSLTSKLRFSLDDDDDHDDDDDDDDEDDEIKSKKGLKTNTSCFIKYESSGLMTNTGSDHL